MIGNQIPRICIEPDRVSSDGKGASMLMAKYAKSLDEWQENILECWLGKDENGNYSMTSGGLSVPRQNGKNFCLEAREFYGLVINGEKILHTAHQVRTAKKSFRRLVRMFSNKKHPEISSLVENIRYTNGEEAIELTNGGLIEFCSRSKQTARGFDGLSLIIYDEAQELTDDQVEAIMATLSASDTGTRQIIYTGTPPYPNCLGTVFLRFRNNILSSDNSNTKNAWHEWSVNADSIEDIKVDDKELWRLCNPAMGVRLTEEFTQEEFNTLSIDGFCRERLGWYSKTASEPEKNFAINHDKWELCKSDALKPDGKTAYGIKFSADGSEVCLCGACTDSDGITRISVIDRRSTGIGLNWLATWLNERYKKASCVVIDGRNGVDVLVEKIHEVWIFKDAIIRPSINQVIASVSMLVDEINEQSITWFSKDVMLEDSALTSVKRPIGKGWGFGGENSLPIEACSLALYGVKTSKRNPQKIMKIG